MYTLILEKTIDRIDFAIVVENAYCYVSRSGACLALAGV
jgi:hypothetical protein